MPFSTAPSDKQLSVRYADWLPALLVALLLVALWSAMVERAYHEEELLAREAFVNHGNIAQAMTIHLDQIIARLRTTGHLLTSEDQAERARIVLRAALAQDRSFLLLMHFGEEGRLLYSTRPDPETWLLGAARGQATTLAGKDEEQIAIGPLPPETSAHPRSLPLFYKPPRAAGRGFILALVDLDVFAKRFAGIDLGKSGEIVLAAADGRELLNMREGLFNPVASITDSRRLQLAFTQGTGHVTEWVRDAHERLYAVRRVADTPLAVLVSRTRYDLLLKNQANKRGYWLSATLATLGLIAFFFFWLSVARRRGELVKHLVNAQEDNTRLIRQLAEEREANYRLATHDKLTGLANRMLFAEIAERYCARAKRLRKRFAIMFIDLDRFKPINDTHGHRVGDQLLIEVARRLQACVRETDLVARLGGDEFVILVGDLHGSFNAEFIAEKVIASLSKPATGIVANGLHVTPSIGISFYPDDATEIETLLRQADTAMYRAKEQGRATFTFADPALNRRNDLNNRIETLLPEALRNREIQLQYQPKVALDDFRIVGLEALARWHHSQLGYVPPADFVAVAEKCGAILTLGEYVIDAACCQIDAWRRAGVPVVPVAVNISPRQLRSPYLYGYILHTLDRYDIPPHLLELEITETGLIDADDSLADVLGRLDSLGVHLTIDDFGTGFSGLSHLRKMPAKTLKIDRCFIRDIRNDINDAKIVSSTIALSHNLHLKVVAEGVETLEQLAHLKANGCDQAQGYLFSPPQDATKIAACLHAGYCQLVGHELASLPIIALPFNLSAAAVC